MQEYNYEIQVHEACYKMDLNESISLYCSFPWIQDGIQRLILFNSSIV